MATSNKRQAISKKTRFDVFKRDGFACGYCGASPPSVLLEIDHIEPVAKGGTNDINNLITACFDCNRGKRHIKLDQVPPTLAYLTDVVIERESQYHEYQKLLRRIERRETREIAKIEALWGDVYKGYSFAESFRKSVRIFIQKLGFHKTKEAMDIVLNRNLGPGASLRYYCGVCWNMIKGGRI